ncbi:MFS transporter [Helicobacter sp. 11S03491-1]|uniref:MFS transporter n=1 Tax=Helicobacter sp. 11S03491-1 TaxID=1476196 RepID=UPI000BA66339|nr:MFS transporter [Helicobacter sp. 11S03491-1]PAF43428.1 MFS transporter [Helicobacter sp. 11S03491-1]
MKNKLTTRAIVAAAIGNALEWYDFSVFAFFASYIAHNFFIDGDGTSALFSAFLLFGVGFIARPLGALFLGSYGDRAGRKAALTLTILLMAVGTLIIAIAPPIWFIGIGAPILLLIARLLQGFSTGGEIGGAAAFLIEYAPKEKKGVYSSWLQASMGISNILAALAGILITYFFSEKEILDWAWRLAFVFGLLIIPVGLYIRKTLDETPEFQDQIKKDPSKIKHHRPLFDLFKRYPRQLVEGILFSILWTSSVYTLIIYMPTYYTSSVVGLGFSKSESFSASFIGNIFMVIGCVVAGKLADKFGIKKILQISIVVMLVAIFPLLYWLHATPSFEHLILIHTFFCLCVAFFVGVAPVALAILYPVAIRSSGMAISYNTAAIFFAGFTPALMTWATQYSVYAPAYYLAFCCVLAFASVIFMFKEKK